MQNLRALAKSECDVVVIRDGQPKHIHSTDLVPGKKNEEWRGKGESKEKVLRNFQQERMFLREKFLPLHYLFIEGFFFFFSPFESFVCL